MVDYFKSFGREQSWRLLRAFEVHNRPFAIRGHVTSFFDEYESYMILPSKTISGSYLKQNNSDLAFQTRTIFLKWVSS